MVNAPGISSTIRSAIGIFSRGSGSSIEALAKLTRIDNEMRDLRRFGKQKKL
jgi:hypothetical protein